jgi:hypothetical protein
VAVLWASWTEPLQYHNYSWDVAVPNTPQQKAARGKLVI